MSWTLRVRPNPGALITAEYECPAHGYFAATLARDTQGDAPARAPCPGDGAGPCGELAPWRPSSVASRVSSVSVATGKVGEYPPAAHCLDTRPLADGMPEAEWRAKQSAITRAELVRKRREAMGQRGKIFIG